MSKLYDVISRLEDVASQEKNGPDVLSPEVNGQPEPEKERRPWKRVLLLALLFIALGVVAIGATAWLQQKFTSRTLSTSPARSSINPEIVLTAPVQDQFPAPIIQEEPSPVDVVQILPTNPPLLQKAQTSTPENITELFQGTMSIDVAMEDITVESLDYFLQTAIFDLPDFLESDDSWRTTIFIHDLDIAEAINDSSVVIEPVPYTHHDTAAAENLKASSSRWLHQAELYRHNGEWEGAILLYQRVWDISQDPDVANNLAAALIEMNRPEEAHRILKDTIASAPNDPDIKLNLRIVEQILAQ